MTTPEPRPRLLSLLVIMVLQWFMMLVPGWVAPGTRLHFYGGFFTPFVGGIAVAVWWLLAKPLAWRERLLGLLLFTGLVGLTCLLADPSFELIWLLLHGMPFATTAVALWLVVTPRLHWPVRRVGLVVVLVLVWGFFTLVRHEGLDGNFAAAFPWRWSASAEDLYLAEREARRQEAAKASSQPSAEPIALQPGDWPGFRGPERDGRLAGVRIATDWEKLPPKQLWKKRIGPGWSSFAVVGTRLYTQEQRGAHEAVVCYDAATGSELWSHQDAARFSETMAGPGPRATPTFHDGKIYAQGATGKLNCLDALDGRRLWSRDVAADAGAKVPQWGFAASPVVAQGVVAVFGGGPDGKSVIGYDATSGEIAWSAGSGRFSYCSLHPARVEGIEQLLIATDRGLASYEPKRGEVLWTHAWPLPQGMSRIVQPNAVGDADFLVGTGFGHGTRRLNVRRDKETWAVKEVWTTGAIKPYYGDLVVHGGHLYGFDHTFLTCVNLTDGKSKWRTGDYGSGQVLLLADQDLLLIQADSGEVALVDAKAEEHNEVARFEALTGKTWNHPVVAHGKLFVRNGKHAACYKLPVEP